MFIKKCVTSVTVLQTVFQNYNCTFEPARSSWFVTHSAESLDNTDDPIALVSPVSSTNFTTIGAPTPPHWTCSRLPPGLCVAKRKKDTNFIIASSVWKVKPRAQNRRPKAKNVVHEADQTLFTGHLSTASADSRYTAMVFTSTEQAMVDVAKLSSAAEQTMSGVAMVPASSEQTMAGVAKLSLPFTILVPTTCTMGVLASAGDNPRFLV